MKILIIDNCVDLVGGVERTINTLANELIKDNEVDILSERCLVEESFYNYNEKINKFYLFNNLNYKSRKLKKGSVIYYLYKIIELIKEKELKKKLIKRFFKSHKEYDVIVCGRVLIALDFLTVLKKININSKIIVRDAIHLYYFNKNIQKKLKKYFPKLVNTFIVSSEESINSYNKFFKTNDIDLIKIYNPLGIKPINKFNFNNKTVISIGRLDDDQKGFDNLIKAFCMVHEIHSDWKLTLYGDGGTKSKLCNLINELGASKYIEIKPSTKNVVEVFNQSSIFVLPSRYEGYANILVEALACGIPSISYDWYMGVEEIIKDNTNGLIVKLKDRKKYFDGCSIYEDCKSLCDKICYLVENEDKANELSKEAIKIIDGRNPDLILNEWLKIIKK